MRPVLEPAPSPQTPASLLRGGRSPAWRRALRSIRPLRSAWYLALALEQLARNRWRGAREFDREFARAADPWGYTRELERERHRLALGLVDAVAGEARLGRVLEVGCAEGMFTAALASRCASLLALDISVVALSRAAERVAGVPHVGLRLADLRRDPLGGDFDAVIVMDVLSYFCRPWQLRRALDRVIAATAVGGHIVFCDVRQTTMFETAWWGRPLLRGGVRIREHLAARPALRLVSSATTELHALALLQRVA